MAHHVIGTPLIVEHTVEIGGQTIVGDQEIGHTIQATPNSGGNTYIKRQYTAGDHSGRNFLWMGDLGDWTDDLEEDPDAAAFDPRWVEDQ